LADGRAGHDGPLWPLHRETRALTRLGWASTPAVMSKSDDYRAKTLECDDRARTASRYETRVQLQESAKQWRALAAQWERLDAEQTQSDTQYLRSRHPHGRFPWRRGQIARRRSAANQRMERCATLFRQRKLPEWVALNETSENRGRYCRAPDAGPRAPGMGGVNCEKS
jgi:hypothetical protein